MIATTDDAAMPVLEAFGLTPDAFLGSGGEARVYALDAERVLRICHPGADPSAFEGRVALMQELAGSADLVSFAISQTLETMQVAGRLVAIEQRLPGRPMSQALNDLTGERRAGLLRSYMDAANQIGNLRLERPWYGNLRATDAIRTKTYREYLERSAAHGLLASGVPFAGVDSAELASALPEPEYPALVHLDVFPGNVLEADGRITAVLDFGSSSIIGDRRLDPLSAAVYLTGRITPNATDEDRSVCIAWLAEHGYESYFQAVERWLAAYWAFATDDISLFQWVQEVLGRQ
jgi:Ser/Thr protein kinase RdoA (MazF antagonist)